MARDYRSLEAQEYRHLYSTARWKRTRQAQLAEHPLCETCLERGIITPATVCNHKDKDSKATPDGFFAGPFSSLCAPCHDQTEQRQEKAGYSFAIGADGWPTDAQHPANTGSLNAAQPIGTAKTHPTWFRKVHVPTTLVCGPPASGKSTYVRQNAGEHDRIICFDTIAASLFGKPGDVRAIDLTSEQIGDTLRQRNEQIADLMWAKAQGKWPHAWIIVTEPKASHRQWWADTLGCRVVVLATPEQECIRRIRADRQAGDRRSHEAERIVRRWWSQYEPRQGDEMLSP